MEVASTSENADAARRELSRGLLDVPEVGANAILELQVRRYTMQEARRVRAERDEVLAVLQSR